MVSPELENQKPQHNFVTYTRFVYIKGVPSAKLNGRGYGWTSDYRR